MGNLGTEELASILAVVRRGQKGREGTERRESMFGDSFNTFIEFYYGPSTRADKKIIK